MREMRMPRVDKHDISPPAQPLPAVGIELVHILDTDAVLPATLSETLPLGVQYPGLLSVADDHVRPKDKGRATSCEQRALPDACISMRAPGMSRFRKA